MIVINILEIIGTIAFAISGALRGIEKRLDIFGVAWLAITTALGGGIFRDLILGQTPPVAFVYPKYTIVAIVVAIITYIFNKYVDKLQPLISLSDAIGLGVFTAMGSNAAINLYGNEPFLVIAMGLMTGVGGGILRDIFVKDIPFVFRKEIYAVACIAGASVFYVIYNYVPVEVGIYICFAVTFIIRMVSIKYNLNLPSKKADSLNRWEALNKFSKGKEIILLTIL